MHDILSNQRFLTVASDSLGRDWFDKSQQLDQQLEALGLELSEESVYLIFDRSPGAILALEGQCLIARPVIGPKKELSSPFAMHDWAQASVWRYQAKLTQWSDLLNGAYNSWEELQRLNSKLRPSFMVAVKRTLKDKLELNGEVLFY